MIYDAHRLELLPTGHASHGLGDVCTFPFGFLKIQAAPGDLAIADAHDRHAAFLQGRPILLGPVPDPFTPLLVPNDGVAEELGLEVRDALIKLRPILPHVFASAECSRWMDGLLTSVILLKKAKLTLQVMAFTASRRLTLTALPRSCSLPLIYCLLSALPPVPQLRCASSDMILPLTESLEQQQSAECSGLAMPNPWRISAVRRLSPSLGVTKRSAFGTSAALPCCEPLACARRLPRTYGETPYSSESSAVSSG